MPETAVKSFRPVDLMKKQFMKRILLIMLATAAGLAGLQAQTKYLVNTLSPVESHCYTAYKYTGPASRQIAMSGGLDWYGGFTIGHSVGPYVPGYATFRLGKKYDKLMFVLGHENFNRGAGGTGIAVDPCIFTIQADGKKIFDELVYPYGIPKRITLDVKDVDELKFALVSGGGYIGVAEATLWTAGQTPVETGNIITEKPKRIELLKDLQPYFQNYRMCSVSPSGKIKSVMINGQKYEYGLSANMTRAISGNSSGWAYFNLRKQYSTLTFIAGPINSTDSDLASGWLTVKADGKIISEIELHYDDIAQKYTLDITGCEMLSFHSEQTTGSLEGGLVQIIAYPEGDRPQEVAGTEATVDPRLKKLPDVCKLISNVRPYSAQAFIDKQIYDGSSDYITFSMGGVKFNEGIVLYNKASILDDNTSAFAVFDLGNEFDYVSFTAGYIGKSGAMNNDLLRVYADDSLVLEAPLMATYPNQKYVVPINRCRKLRFENRGSGTLDVAAYGIADLVVYRGEPVENDLFVHPVPACPPEIDLIDLGAPYIHYVSPMEDHADEIFYDGSTKKKYFDLNGTRIYKGFMLQTSVHFSLDFGPLSGSDNAAAGVVGATAVGSAIVAGTTLAGGAMIGSTLAGVAAFLALAAGGEALENSCAAFNTYGEYNSLTFTVACYKPYIREDDYTETLLIGADRKVVAVLGLSEKMKPQTVTVPIDGCSQLMFWLANTDNWSGQYIFYDIKLSKEHCTLNIPKGARLSQPVITKPAWTKREFKNNWERVQSTGRKDIDYFFRDLSIAYEKIQSFAKKTEPWYEIYTYYLETNAGQYCKAVTLESTHGENLSRFIEEFRGCDRILQEMITVKDMLNDLSARKVGVSLSLPSLGLGAVSYGKVLKYGFEVLDECRTILNAIYEDKLSEASFLKAVMDSAVDIDGKQSTEYTIFCPLFKSETPPNGLLQLVENFRVR